MTGRWGYFAWGGTTYYQYDYDLAGNRTRKRTGCGKWTYYVYAADNSLTKHFLDDLSSATYFHYDKSGSCEKVYSPDGTTYFEYADANLPKEVAIEGGSTVEFRRGGGGERRSRGN